MALDVSARRRHPSDHLVIEKADVEHISGVSCHVVQLLSGWLAGLRYMALSREVGRICCSRQREYY